MKNLLIFIDPVAKKFGPEHEQLTQIQIDNSLDLGWKLADLMLVTNFPYEYRGVRSIIVGDYVVIDQNRSAKIPALNQLFRDGKITNDVYWFHDHDAFQLQPLEFQLQKDAAFSDHGYWSPTWNAGSFFFNHHAGDIFERINYYMNLRSTNEQRALTYMWENNLQGINDRYQKLNNTYNIGIYKIPQNVADSELPIKVAHFHPHKRRHLDLFRHLLPDRLLTIFRRHGIS